MKLAAQLSGPEIFKQTCDDSAKPHELKKWNQKIDTSSE
jgi:hypothetical protein